MPSTVGSVFLNPGLTGAAKDVAVAKNRATRKESFLFISMFKYIVFLLYALACKEVVVLVAVAIKDVDVYLGAYACDTSVGA